MLRSRGFTLIELLVVMTVLGLLLSLAAPRYVEHVDRARDRVLKQNLVVMRETLDKFYSDKARYPASLQELVFLHYLREVPVDPVTERDDTWILVPPPGQTDTKAVFDVHSGAPGNARDGTIYAQW